MERFETFTVLIAKISRNIKKIKNQEMAEYGLRSVHVSCLYYLYSEESLTATELCELCEEDKATISRALDHLEKNGFIVRTPDENDARISRVRLTEEGRAQCEKARRIFDETCHQMLDGLDDSSISQLSALLTRIQENLGGMTCCRMETNKKE